jgi:hypothetical protein
VHLSRYLVDRVEPPISLAPETRFGEFMLLEVLGRGAGSVVYRAEQLATSRQLALKVLAPTDGQRFALEVEALTRLDHPGVARIHYSGTVRTNGLTVPYLAMELVDGLPLHEFAVARRLAVRARVELLVQVADAVEYAHRRGVIHRDLKPGNVLVSDAHGPPRARVLDFGLARVLQSVVVPAHQTIPGTILGTPGYMSPEQAAGSPDIDTRADVYALGALLYELLSGRRPLDTGDRLDVATLLRIQREEPAPLASFGAVPEDLDLVVAKALAKDREARYASASEFAADLRRYLRGQSVLAGAGRRRYVWSRFLRRHWIAVSAGAVLLASCAVAVVGVGYGLWCARAAVRDAIGMAAATLNANEGMATLAGSRELQIVYLNAQMPFYSQFVVGSPNDTQALATLALAKRQLANLRRDGGEWDASVALRKECAVLRERLWRLAPDDAMAELEWAIEKVLSADALKEFGDRTGAELAYVETHAVFERLAKRFPDQRRYVDEFGWSLERLCQVDLDGGRLAGLQVLVAQRRANVAQLDLLAPADSSTKRSRVSLRNFEAALAAVLGETDKELALRRWAYQTAETTAREHPGNFETRRALLSVASVFAQALWDVGDSAQALSVVTENEARAAELLQLDCRDERTLMWAATLGRQLVDLALVEQQLASARAAVQTLGKRARSVGLPVRPGWRARVLIDAVERERVVAALVGQHAKAIELRRELWQIRLDVALHADVSTDELREQFLKLAGEVGDRLDPRLWRVTKRVLRDQPDSWQLWLHAAEIALAQREWFDGLCYLREAERLMVDPAPANQGRIDVLRTALQRR